MDFVQTWSFYRSSRDQYRNTKTSKSDLLLNMNVLNSKNYNIRIM